MDEERTKILEMLQQGQITVEQATKLLDALEQASKAEAKSAPPPEPEPEPMRESGPRNWAEFGRNLAEQLRANITEAISGLSDLVSAGPTAIVARNNFTTLTLTPEYLQRLDDGSSFTNYGRLHIDPEVSAELLSTKIQSYTNFGVTSGPTSLLRILQDHCTMNFGSFVEDGQQQNDETTPRSRDNYTTLTISRDYLSRIQVQTHFTNYGKATVEADVTEELLDQKIASYDNYGQTYVPKALLGYFEARATDYGKFITYEPGAETPIPRTPHGVVSHPPTPPAPPTVTMGTSITGRMLNGWSGWNYEWQYQELLIVCHTGNLHLESTNEGQLELTVQKEVKPGEILPHGWADSIRFAPRQEGNRLTFEIGDPNDRSITNDMTFSFRVPEGVDIIADSAAGDIAAEQVAASVDLRTAGGNITCNEIGGDAVVTSSGGNLELSDISGSVRAETAGGDIKLSDVAGEAVANTAGGGISVNDIAGNATLDSGGGDLSANDVAGAVTARTSGGNIELHDIAGDASASTSGGNVNAHDIAGSVTANTGAGSIEISDVSGDVNAHTDAGTITLSDISGSVEATTAIGDLDISDIAGDVTLETAQGNVSLRDISGEIHQRNN